MTLLTSTPWWVIALAVIGAIALCTAALNLFSSVGDRPGTASILQACEVASNDFLLSLAGTVNAPLQQGGSARLLNNGDQFLPAMLDGIRGARRSVNFMTYIWEPGEVSDRFFDALIDRARAGVPVRVMIDALGGHKAPDARIEELRRAGGRWVWFHPVSFGKLTRLHRRNHRRAIVVDGELGYTGGFAVADKWLGDGVKADCWRDSAIEVRGRIATNLQAAFAQLWSDVTGEMFAGPAFFPGDLSTPGDQALETREGSGPGEPLSYHVNVVSSPSSESFPLRRVFWMSFRSAERCLYITNPYFVPDNTMAEVLKERARAGVDVRVLVPNEHIDITFLRWASHAYYEELLEAGVRIYEYQPAMIHQKLLVVDDRWSVVGSANMDVRSKELNQENVLGIADEGFAREVRETFFADLEHAQEIRLDQWRRRPLLHRARERFARLFEEQF